MSNFIANSKKSDLKKRLIELISKSEELKFLVGIFYFSGIRDMVERCRAVGLSEPQFTLTDGFVITIKRKPDLAFKAVGGTTGEVTGEVAGELALQNHGQPECFQSRR